jgi:hypothetical protein
MCQKNRGQVVVWGPPGRRLSAMKAFGTGRN